MLRALWYNMYDWSACQFSCQKLFSLYSTERASPHSLARMYSHRGDPSDGIALCRADTQPGWEYNPASAPAAEPDAAQLMQLQVCMHATGAKQGFVVSWARTGMLITCSQLSMLTVKAVARNISIVHDEYGNPGASVPCSLSEFSPAHRAALNDLAVSVGALCTTFRRVDVAGKHLTYLSWLLQVLAAR